ncbi:hypothetical protein J4407_02425 [Candidatus Pacearchaeota archaeon]|nr:hypothetical protein [Candidatus Pacearchaeota archaeon]
MVENKSPTIEGFRNTLEAMLELHKKGNSERYLSAGMVYWFGRNGAGLNPNGLWPNAMYPSSKEDAQLFLEDAVNQGYIERVFAEVNRTGTYHTLEEMKKFIAEN